MFVKSAFIVALASLLLACTEPPQAKKADAPSDPALMAMIDQCHDITERAAAHLVAVVEFQRLEIIGRKARVFKQCMQDHGYIENKQWLAYSQPVAKTVAKQTNISIDEALENLRRANMVLDQGEDKRPVYWVKASAK